MADVSITNMKGVAAVMWNDRVLLGQLELDSDYWYFTPANGKRLTAYQLEEISKHIYRMNKRLQ